MNSEIVDVNKFAGKKSIQERRVLDDSVAPEWLKSPGRLQFSAGEKCAEGERSRVWTPGRIVIGLTP